MRPEFLVHSFALLAAGVTIIGCRKQSYEEAERLYTKALKLLDALPTGVNEQTTKLYEGRATARMKLNKCTLALLDCLLACRSAGEDQNQIWTANGFGRLMAGRLLLTRAECHERLGMWSLAFNDFKKAQIFLNLASCAPVRMNVKLTRNNTHTHTVDSRMISLVLEYIWI